MSSLSAVNITVESYHIKVGDRGVNPSLIEVGQLCAQLECEIQKIDHCDHRGDHWDGGGNKLYGRQNFLHKTYLLEGPYRLAKLNRRTKQKGGGPNYMECRIMSIQLNYKKAHINWPNCMREFSKNQKNLFLANSKWPPRAHNSWYQAAKQ